MTKFAPYTATGPFGHYQERLKEIGRLAARLDGDPRHPLEVILDFFEVDEIDRKVVEDAHFVAAYWNSIAEAAQRDQNNA